MALDCGIDYEQSRLRRNVEYRMKGKYNFLLDEQSRNARTSIAIAIQCPSK